MNKSKFLKAVFVFLFIAGIVPAQAGTKTWKAAITGDWFTVGNWTNGDYPRVGDDVVITNVGASVLLTNSTEYLSSFMISNTATLVFSNWNTKLSATNVYIRTNATMTLPDAFTNNAMSNNVYIVCYNLTIDAGGKIDVNLKGYSSGLAAGASGFGPGGSSAGASYGGIGGGGPSPYGSVSAPIDPGSGGRMGNNTVGGKGGGAVHIEATNNVVLNGVITANGGSYSGYNAGGGSGGGIYIVCNTLAGTNGLVSADGGYGQGGGGGGGRIAVIYTNAAAQNAAPVPDIIFSAAGSPPDPVNASVLGDIGTLYFPDNRFLTETIRHKGQWAVAGFTNWAPNNLTITNGWIRFNPEGFRLAVSNQLTIVGAGAIYHKLELSNGWLSCGGNLTLANASLILWRGTTYASTLTCGGNFLLTNNAVLSMYSSPTNAIFPTYGALVDVTGAMTLGGTNCWIYPTADPTNGSSVLFRMGNLTITSNSGFNADSSLSVSGLRGYATGFGPGKGGGPGINAGGGYGGLGGAASGGYGQTYGSSNAPVEPGSGGSYYSSPDLSCRGGVGGGSVRIQSSGTVTFNGTITANGAGRPGYGAAGGAGGGVYILCRHYAGANGLISAIGANGTEGGGGGGGRIAVWRIVDQSTGPTTASVASGTGTAAGAPGTVVWGWLPAQGTWFVIH